MHESQFIPVAPSRQLHCDVDELQTESATVRVFGAKHVQFEQPFSFDASRFAVPAMHSSQARPPTLLLHIHSPESELQTLETEPAELH